MNQSGQVVNIAHVLGTFYDSRGQIVWVSDGYANRALLPQTPVAFSLPLSGGPGRQDQQLPRGDQHVQRGPLPMKRRLTFVLLGAMLMSVIVAGGLYLSAADGDALQIPKVVEAGSSFSIPTRAAGKAVLYIVSPAQVLRRNVEPGESVVIAAGDLHNAGHYLALLAGPGTTEKAEFDVVAASQPASLNFLAKPSRLPVGRPGRNQRRGLRI